MTAYEQRLGEFRDPKGQILISSLIKNASGAKSASEAGFL